jgi:hypothetical protein
MKMRTEPCIALYPSTNMNGSWILYNLKTNKYVRRTQWRKMVMSQPIIDIMNLAAGAGPIIQQVDLPEGSG